MECAKQSQGGSYAIRLVGCFRVIHVYMWYHQILFRWLTLLKQESPKQVHLRPSPNRKRAFQHICPKRNRIQLLHLAVKHKMKYYCYNRACDVKQWKWILLINPLKLLHWYIKDSLPVMLHSSYSLGYHHQLLGLDWEIKNRCVFMWANISFKARCYLSSWGSALYFFVRTFSILTLHGGMFIYISLLTLN